MPNYTKLFNSIITSTIWTEDDKTRIMWITMLAISDKNGEVHASVPGLARVSGMAIPEAEEALRKLSSPDSYSRTPDNEGRRIAKIDGGWELLNHRKYRLMASREDEKAATAERVRRHRSRGHDVTECNGTVTVGNDPVTEDLHIADTDTDTDTDTKSKVPPNPQTPSASPSSGELDLGQSKAKAGITEGKPSKLLPTTDQSKRIAAILRRRVTTPWTDKEVRAYKKIGIIPEEDLKALEAYYAENWPPAMGVNQLRHDLLTLLNNFPGEVGRAHTYAKHGKQGIQGAHANTSRPVPPKGQFT